MISGTATTAPIATRLGADLNRLWAAYGVSQVGSAIGYGALPLVAVLVLDATVFQVTLLAALSGVAGALIALGLGPIVEFRRKRPLMVAADLIRFAALAPSHGRSRPRPSSRSSSSWPASSPA